MARNQTAGQVQGQIDTFSRLGHQICFRSEECRDHWSRGFRCTDTAKDTTTSDGLDELQSIESLDLGRIRGRICP